MLLSHRIIRELLQSSAPQLKELDEVYANIPATRCLRRTVCCSLLPEMTLVEALSAIRQLVCKKSFLRKKLFEKIVRYFFLNPIELTSCPFLYGQDCLIYMHRFFGCRAYGLWSKGYYEKLVESSRQAKNHIQNQWQLLGITLPEAVIHFQVPYCSNVTIDSNASIDDEVLFNVSENIETLSQHCYPWHQSFRENYFSDLSFLLTSLVFGVPESVRMKFFLVRDIITSGNRSELERIVKEVSDPFDL